MFGFQNFFFHSDQKKSLQNKSGKNFIFLNFYTIEFDGAMLFNQISIIYR